MSNFKIRKFSDKAERREYAKISQNTQLVDEENQSYDFKTSWEFPDLIKNHTHPYAKFLKKDLEETFREIFPISSNNGKYELVFEDLWLDTPKRNIREAKYYASTYESSIFASIYLLNNETGEKKYPRKSIKNPKRAIYFGELPLMTPKGTFIINGNEKVVINQIVKSPGTYFKRKTDEKSGRTLVLNEINPGRGSWIEFETHPSGTVFVRIDKSKRLNALVLFQALGVISKPAMKDDQTTEKRDANFVKSIKKIFGHSTLIKPLVESNTTPNIEDAVKEVYNRLRPGEPFTYEGAIGSLAHLLFNSRRYDLTDAGRYKLNTKLRITHRLSNKVLAKDILDVKGNVFLKKGILFDKPEISKLKKALRDGRVDISSDLKINESLQESANRTFLNKIEAIELYTDNEVQKDVIRILGISPEESSSTITITDIVAAFSYLLGLEYNIGKFDDIDHLGNRRIRLIDELLKNQFRIGLSRMDKNIKEKLATTEEAKITAKSVINIKPLTAVVKEFFNSYQLTQFMDQMNPLSELTNKRRLTALGPGGLSRDRAGFEVRDVHYSHYGRLCPIETPEGQNIGLINNFSTFARVNRLGFIETPYRILEQVGENYYVTNKVKYLTASEEEEYVIAGADIKIDDNGKVITDHSVARYKGVSSETSVELIDFVDTTPKQVVSVATALIPFLENNDANRALMGANMQRQAVPLLKPEAPIVATGVEYFIGRDSGSGIIADNSGTITYQDSTKIEITKNDGEKEIYPLQKFQRSNQESIINQVPIYKVNDEVKKGTIIADGSSMENGELAIGKNLLVAFATWNGYNYEDAIIMSDRIFKDDILTSLHTREYTIECRRTQLGDEEITREIPNTSDHIKRYLDERGIIAMGAEVKEGDILVGKVTPKGEIDLNPEEKLLEAIFGEKSKNVRDTSLKVPHGGDGVVAEIKVFSSEDGVSNDADVKSIIKVYIVQKRKIQVGDKMAGRHGNKGVISSILSAQDMPHMPDGTPVDIMLNPLGIPSRMNIGQILEVHLGLAAKKLGVKISTPVFEGVNNEDLIQIMEEAKLDEWGFDKSGKVLLTDGKTGEQFDKPISVGIMYMLKLSHMIDDKLHARSVGPYSKITQQPLGGKAQKGGQRFGEMEVWALEAYGAAHTLREILTIKSDDIKGRNQTYSSIIKGWDIPEPGLPESFRLLTKELQGLGLFVKLIDAEGTKHEFKEIEEEVDLQGEIEYTEEYGYDEGEIL